MMQYYRVSTAVTLWVLETRRNAELRTSVPVSIFDNLLWSFLLGLLSSPLQTSWNALTFLILYLFLSLSFLGNIYLVPFSFFTQAFILALFIWRLLYLLATSLTFPGSTAPMQRTMESELGQYIEMSSKKACQQILAFAYFLKNTADESDNSLQQQYQHHQHINTSFGHFIRDGSKNHSNLTLGARFHQSFARAVYAAETILEPVRIVLENLLGENQQQNSNNSTGKHNSIERNSNSDTSNQNLKNQNQLLNSLPPLPAAPAAHNNKRYQARKLSPSLTRKATSLKTSLVDLMEQLTVASSIHDSLFAAVRDDIINNVSAEKDQLFARHWTEQREALENIAAHIIAHCGIVEDQLSSLTVAVGKQHSENRHHGETGGEGHQKKSSQEIKDVSSIANQKEVISGNNGGSMTKGHKEKKKDSSYENESQEEGLSDNELFSDNDDIESGSLLGKNHHRQEGDSHSQFLGRHVSSNMSSSSHIDWKRVREYTLHPLITYNDTNDQEEEKPSPLDDDETDMETNVEGRNIDNQSKQQEPPLLPLLFYGVYTALRQYILHLLSTMRPIKALVSLDYAHYLLLLRHRGAQHFRIQSPPSFSARTSEETGGNIGKFLKRCMERILGCGFTSSLGLGYETREIDIYFIPSRRSNSSMAGGSSASSSQPRPASSPRKEEGQMINDSNVNSTPKKSEDRASTYQKNKTTRSYSGDEHADKSNSSSDKVSSNEPIMIMCGPNAGIAEFSCVFGDWIRFYTQECGISVVVFNYAGYGRSEGSPSPCTLGQDAASVVDWVYRERKKTCAEQPLIGIHAESIGGVAALRGLSDYPQVREHVNFLLCDRTMSDLPTTAAFLMGRWAYYGIKYLTRWDTDNVNKFLNECQSIPTRVVANDRNDHIIKAPASLLQGILKQEMIQGGRGGLEVAGGNMERIILRCGHNSPYSAREKEQLKMCLRKAKFIL
eukprot:g23.t1